MSGLGIDTSSAISMLRQVSSFGLESQASQPAMLQVIEEVERQSENNVSAELEYWLGIAWRNYTAWFIKGNDREPYLERAVRHFEKACEISKSGSKAEWKVYAGELGYLLVDEALIRNLEQGISLLEKVYRATRSYEPSLCSYAEALYKSGDYQRAAEVATELHRRAQKSREWRDCVPPAPMRIAAKAYRTHIKQLKKAGQVEEAFVISEQLSQTGFATDNDQRIHKSLALLVNKT